MSELHPRIYELGERPPEVALMSLQEFYMHQYADFLHDHINDLRRQMIEDQITLRDIDRQALLFPITDAERERREATHDHLMRVIGHAGICMSIISRPLAPDYLFFLPMTPDA
jgi:hypothetical protein